VFIYASSASVYDGKISAIEGDAGYVVRNEYDLSKSTLDRYIQLIPTESQWYGLRFGTVCGGSRNFRTDVMINCMYHTAKTAGEVYYTDPIVQRPILGMLDLCRAMEVLIEGQIQKGIYNLSSGNYTSNQVAKQVAELLKVPVVKREGQGIPYDFGMSNKKFRDVAGFRFQDDPESIVNDIGGYYVSARKTHRSDPR